MGGEAKTTERVRLQADLIRDGRATVSAKVLNDAVVSVYGMSRIIEINIEIDGAQVTTCRAYCKVPILMPVLAPPKLRTAIREASEDSETSRKAPGGRGWDLVVWVSRL